MNEVTEPGRIGYYHDENDEECLAVDVRGLALEKGGILWVWPYVPKLQTTAGVYLYPNSVPTTDCTPSNSVNVGLAEEPTERYDGRRDEERIWIPLKVPERDLSGIWYLLLPTYHVDVPGWGRIRPR
ncbi:MAG: hypothetical protein ACOC6F_00915 [bacterium]